MMRVDRKVCIKCFTYNHASYIEDAMQGFVMQETDFPFVAVIVDDCSTDGEQEVIKAFLAREFDMDSARTEESDDAIVIEARHKTNGNCSFTVVFLKYNYYGIRKSKSPYFKKYLDNVKYCAYCEGDDYWVDACKLKKQVDFLESHPEVSLCFHNVKVFDVPKNSFSDDFITRDVPGFSDTRELAHGNYIHTLSVLVRYDESVMETIEKMGLLYMSDYPAWMLYSKNGSIYKFPEVMAVYRCGCGIWSSMNEYEGKIKSIPVLAKMACFFEGDIRKELDDILDDYCHSLISWHNKYYRAGILVLYPFKMVYRIIRGCVDKIHGILEG